MFSSTVKWYLIACFVFWIVGAFILFSMEKGDWVIYLNQNRTVQLDFFFKNWTHLGDGLFVLGLAIFLLFVKYRYSVIFAVTAIAQAAISALLKRVVFADHHRPKKFLSGIYELQFIEGVDVHSNYSFPSGHTMSAFFVGTFLVLIIPRKWLGLLLFCYALLVGISRNYLSQHFFVDIYVGSAFGVIITLLCWQLFSRKQARDWLGGSLTDRILRR